MAQTVIDIRKISVDDLRSRKYAEVFPELYSLERVVENNPWHDHQSVFDHVLEVFKGLEKVLNFLKFGESQTDKIKSYLSEQVGQKTRLENLKIAALLHDIAKPDVVVYGKDGTVWCPGHELIAAARVKNFSDRFGLSSSDESLVERIVRYHGFISEILNLMMANKSEEKYLRIFHDTVGDVSIELIIMMQADLLGSDLVKSDRNGSNRRIQLLEWMINKILTNPFWQLEGSSDND